MNLRSPHMHSTPPGRTLRKVLLISALDGWSVVIVASVGVLISVLLGSWVGAGVGSLLTVAGVIELRGRHRLIRGDTSGITALVTAQMMILVIILLYAADNLLRYDEAALMAQITPEIREALVGAQLSVNDLRPMLKPLYVGVYSTVIGVTLFFQGGLALYYRSRKPQIDRELVGIRNEPPPLP